MKERGHTLPTWCDMDRGIDIIRGMPLFNKVTKKDSEYESFLRSRVAPHVPDDLAEDMVAFSMGSEVFSCVLKDVRAEYFNKIIPSERPELHLVISQSGGGKSTLKREIMDENLIALNSDDFKRYHPLLVLLKEHAPSYLGPLTGLDSYLLRDKIFEEAVLRKIGILTEITPSKSTPLGVDVQAMEKKGYAVSAHVLAVSAENSLLGIHERYEKGLTGDVTPKLTDLPRALESIDATEVALNNLLVARVAVKLYARRGVGVESVPSNRENAMEIFNRLRAEDAIRAIPTLDERVRAVRESMRTRNAPEKQVAQFNKIVDILRRRSK